MVQKQAHGLQIPLITKAAGVTAELVQHLGFPLYIWCGDEIEVIDGGMRGWIAFGMILFSTIQMG